MGITFDDPLELVRVLQSFELDTVSLWGEHTHYLWVTTRRRSGPGRSESHAVRARPRVWRQAALQDFLKRLAADSSDAALVLSGLKSLRQIAEPFLIEYRNEEPESFVRRAYRSILGRERIRLGLPFTLSRSRTAFLFPTSSTV